MNKLNNKGFMLLETLIVSTIIISTLIFLYVQFTNIKKSYDVSFRYNTVSGLYMAKEIGDFLVDNDNSLIVTQLEDSENGYIEITDSATIQGDNNIYTNLVSNMKIKTIIYTDDSDKLDILKDYIEGDNLNAIFTEDLKKFIRSIQSSSSKDRIIIEFNDDNDPTDDIKYPSTFATILIGGSN